MAKLSKSEKQYDVYELIQASIVGTEREEGIRAACRYLSIKSNAKASTVVYNFKETLNYLMLKSKSIKFFPIY